MNLVLKLLVRGREFTTKGFLIIIPLGLTIAFLFRYIAVGVAGLMFISLCLSLLKLKKYDLKKSLFLSAITMLITTFCDHFASFLLEYVFEIDYSIELVLLTHHLPVAVLLSFTLAFVLSKFTKKIRQEVNKNEQMQTGMMVIALLMLGSFYGSIVSGIYLGNTIDLIVLNFIFFTLYALLAVISFFFLAKGLKEKYRLKQQKDEQEILKQYTAQIELQYSEMRRFKHDYKNIMSSFVGFLIKEDFQGLKNYYLEKVDKNSTILLNHDFGLEHLRRIKVIEIKSILAVKLMTAKEQEIKVKFEAIEEIETIPMDSLVLVRTLGILLDNAVEELMELEYGLLYVGVVKKGHTLSFIIQNTCRADIPPVHQLKQKGFSTKGNHRGLGLSNVTEFVKKFPSMSVETSVADEVFSQQVIIGG